MAGAHIFIIIFFFFRCSLPPFSSSIEASYDLCQPGAPRSLSLFVFFFLFPLALARSEIGRLNQLLRPVTGRKTWQVLRGQDGKGLKPGNQATVRFSPPASVTGCAIKGPRRMTLGPPRVDETNIFSALVPVAHAWPTCYVQLGQYTTARAQGDAVFGGTQERHHRRDLPRSWRAPMDCRPTPAHPEQPPCVALGSPAPFSFP